VRFDVRISAAAPGVARVFEIHASDSAGESSLTREYLLGAVAHGSYLELFAAIARDFGIRVPRNRQPISAPTFEAPLRPLLTRNLSPDILYGYGDPAVLRVEGAGGEEPARYYAVVTSNDARNAFPILRSPDLEQWVATGFVFPAGQKPKWAAEGDNVSDFWAPEMHLVDGEFRMYFAAREREGHALSIGYAHARSPEGPFTALEAPLLRGNVIDPHLLVDRTGTAFLFWKEDTNDVWPSLLNDLLFEHGDLIPLLYTREDDRRTALLLQSMWPWVRGLGPMERFFAQQVLIEATTSDFAGLRSRLSGLLASDSPPLLAQARAQIAAVRDALTTLIYAQTLSPDGTSLTGERAVVLENDQEWEAHLVEGVWVTQHDGRYYLFYAGNDFSTAQYGIGVAIATSPLGPYRKMSEPLIRSTAQWSGPGHPSVAVGPDGRPRLFLHAFHAGRAGYKEFRALLSAPISFEPDRVVLG
jgi:hypothetical protein